VSREKVLVLHIVREKGTRDGFPVAGLFFLDHMENHNIFMTYCSVVDGHVELLADEAQAISVLKLKR
jgi:hypothetical protein